MDNWLSASLHTGHVVSHWIQTSLGGVNLNDLLQLGLTSLKLGLPGVAERLALLQDLGLGVLSLSDH